MSSEHVSPQAYKGKYGEPSDEGDVMPQNIMFDRRVIRGSTFARHRLPQYQQDQLQAKTYRRPSPKKSQRPEGETKLEAEEDAPAPVAGRVHMDVQTEALLEVLMDKPEEHHVGIQTADMLERPVSPKFIPLPSGESKHTQIEEGDLFDFDLEVEPIIEVLVGKTVDHALMEVLEETELDRLRVHNDEFEQLRNVELAQAQRLEAQESRKFEEKERRRLQEEERIFKEQQLARKISARSVAKDYLSGLEQAVFAKLTEAGHFNDPVEAEVEQTFVPWLVEEASKQVEQANTARHLVQSLFDNAATNAIDQVNKDIIKAQQQLEEEKKEKERLALEEKLAKEAAEAQAAAEAENGDEPADE